MPQEALHEAQIAGLRELAQVCCAGKRRYGVFASQGANGDVDHTFLTSIVDQSGVLRVQYLGVRFDPDEFRRDLLSLVRER